MRRFTLYASSQKNRLRMNIPFGGSRLEKMDFIKVTLSNINTSYKKSMSVSDLEEFMLSGEIQPGFEGQVMHLIDETPTSLVVGAVKQLSAEKNINAKLIWKNLAHVATEIKSPNKFWNTAG